MTRACETLCLLGRTDDPLPFAGEVGGGHLLRRRVAAAPDARRAAPARYETLGKADVNIDYAAAMPARHRVHRALAGLGAGDAVSLVPDGRGRIGIADRTGTRVGRLSKAAAATWGGRLDAVASARVLGMVARTAADEQAAAFGDRIAVPAWEYPILEVRLG